MSESITLSGKGQKSVRVANTQVVNMCMAFKQNPSSIATSECIGNENYNKDAVLLKLWITSSNWTTPFLSNAPILQAEIYAQLGFSLILLVIEIQLQSFLSERNYSICNPEDE